MFQNPIVNAASDKGVNSAAKASEVVCICARRPGFRLFQRIRTTIYNPFCCILFP
jgi:hypothetical protein